MKIQDLLIHDEEPSHNATAKGKQSARHHATPSEIKYFGIEFIHDTICPFCYIGLKNLLSAIDRYKSAHPDAVFEVTCTPFILAPTAPISCKFRPRNIHKVVACDKFYRLGRSLIKKYTARRRRCLFAPVVIQPIAGWY